MREVREMPGFVASVTHRVPLNVPDATFIPSTLVKCTQNMFSSSIRVAQISVFQKFCFTTNPVPPEVTVVHWYNYLSCFRGG